MMTEDTPELMEYIEYDFYDLCYYWEDEGFPSARRLIGRWLGPSHRVGQDMCYYILTANCTVISRSSVEPIPAADFEDPVRKEEIAKLDSAIKDKIGDFESTRSEATGFFTEDILEEELGTPPPIEPEATKPEADETTDPLCLISICQAK